MSKENKISDKQENGNDVSNSTAKPTPEEYGWHNQQNFDDEPSGWVFEGGEEAYYKALKEWKAQQK